MSCAGPVIGQGRPVDPTATGAPEFVASSSTQNPRSLPPARRWPPTLASLAAAQVTNEVGTWISRIALLAFAYRTGHSGLAVVSVFVADAAPRVCLSLPAGDLVARFGPRLSCQAANLIEALLVGMLMMTAPNLGAMLALLAAKSAVDSWYQVGMLALVPRLVEDRSRLLQRNAVLGLGPALMAGVGPALGGMVAAAGGLRPALSADALSFTLSAGLLFAVPKRHAAIADHPRHRVARIVPTLIGTAAGRISVGNGLAAMGGGAFNAILPVFLQEQLALAPGAFGASVAAFGGGAFTVMALLSLLAAKGPPPPRAFFASLLGGGATIGLLSLVRGGGQAALLLAVIGGFSALRGASSRSSVQVVATTGGNEVTLGFYQATMSAGLLAGMLAASGLVSLVSPAVVLALAAVPYPVGLVVAMTASRCDSGWNRPKESGRRRGEEEGGTTR
jgi:hypothetical protein